jgi:hypothetical protein
MLACSKYVDFMVNHFLLYRDYGEVNKKTFFLNPALCNWNNTALSMELTYRNAIVEAETAKNEQVSCWWLEPIMAFGDFKVGKTGTRWTVETTPTYFQVS